MSNKSNFPKTAVIGCGYWGKNIVRNVGELGALVAICDENKEQATALASKYNAAVYTIEEVLDNGNIEAVMIATPAVTHYEIAKKAILSGKHVFVEKPLALAVEEAEELCVLAEKHGKTLMVGHLLQYHPVFWELKNIVNSGKIGDVQYIYSNRLNFGKIRREENILWSFAPHDISMILSLVKNAPVSVNTVAHNYLNQDISDVTVTHLSFENGINAHIFVSWLHPYKDQKLVVVGKKGMLVFNDTEPWEKKLQFYKHEVEEVNEMPVARKADVEYIEVEEGEPLRNECEHFFESIQNKTTPISDGYEGLEVLKVLNEASKEIAKVKEHAA